MDDPAISDTRRTRTLSAPTLPRAGVRADVAPVSQGVRGTLLGVLERDPVARSAARCLDQARAIRLEGDVVEIVTDSKFVADLIARRLGTTLERAASQSLLGGRAARVRYVVDAAAPSDASGADAGDVSERDRPTHAVRRGGDAIGPRPSGVAAPAVPAAAPRPRAAALALHRLEDFVVGASNRLAHAAAVRLCDGPGVLSPLFLHGSCGQGKTHLLQGIARRVRELNPSAKVRYVTAETFTNEFIASLRSGTIEAFRRAHRRLSVLCIDDVHFLSSKEATQAELLHTLDSIGLDGARIALASDEHPRDIRKLSSALCSRFMSGALFKLESPDPELRLALAGRMSAGRSLMLDAEAARVLAGAGWQSVRELEGLCTQIAAVLRLQPELARPEGGVGASALRRAMEIAGAGATLPSATLASPRSRRPVPMPLIQAEVTRSLCVSSADMAGKGRHKRVVLARSIVVLLARRLTTLSFPEIARAMGRPNHSSVITAYNRLLGQIGETSSASRPDAQSLHGGLAVPAGTNPALEHDLMAELVAELGPEFAGLTLRALCEQLQSRVEQAAGKL